MSLNAALTRLLEEYPKEIGTTFTGNPLADYVRNEIPNYIKEIIDNNDRYVIHGSVGQGNWARIPWIAIFDRLITDTAQRGYYIVYLAREDFHGAYLSLNQGVTSIREQYGAEAKHALKIRAKDFIARLGGIDSNYIQGPIELKASQASSLGAYYEAGSICAKFYEVDNIPNDEVLENDLKQMLEYYFVLSSGELLRTKNTTKEDDELQYEDTSLIKEHKRIERNQKLAKKAKEVHGYICQICSFCFTNVYGEIGDKFIEAHHLIPLSKLKGKKIKMNPKRDFAVLCSNCHRMIHRSSFVGDINEFKNNHFIM